MQVQCLSIGSFYVPGSCLLVPLEWWRLSFLALCKDLTQRQSSKISLFPAAWSWRWFRRAHRVIHGPIVTPIFTNDGRRGRRTRGRAVASPLAVHIRKCTQRPVLRQIKARCITYFNTNGPEKVLKNNPYPSHWHVPNSLPWAGVEVRVHPLSTLLDFPFLVARNPCTAPRTAAAPYTAVLHVFLSLYMPLSTHRTKQMMRVVQRCEQVG